MTGQRKRPGARAGSEGARRGAVKRVAATNALYAARRRLGMPARQRRKS